MSPIAIQLRDKRSLGYFIYPAAQQERESERRVESGGGELTHRLLSKKRLSSALQTGKVFPLTSLFIMSSYYVGKI